MDIDYDMVRNLQLDFRIKTVSVLNMLNKINVSIYFQESQDEKSSSLYTERINNLIKVYNEKDPFSSIPEELKTSIQKLQNQFNIATDNLYLENLITTISSSLRKKIRIMKWGTIFGIIGTIVSIVSVISSFLGGGNI